MIEIEVKIRVPDLKTTRQKLLEMGCEIVHDFTVNGMSFMIFLMAVWPAGKKLCG